MASLGLEVAGIVFSLVSAFRSGIEIVDRVGDQRRRRDRRKPGSRHRRNDTSPSASSAQRRLDADEARLSRSLGKGPEHISREYERDLALLGDGFARGDYTLLRLNTGLVNIISSFLMSADDKAVLEGQLDYGSLIRLSEQTRKDAVAALGGLCTRLSTESSLSLAAAPTAQTTEPATPLSPSSKVKRRSKSKRASGGSSGARIFVVRSNRAAVEDGPGRSDVHGTPAKKKTRSKKRVHGGSAVSGGSAKTGSSGRSKESRKDVSQSSLADVVSGSNGAPTPAAPLRPAPLSGRERLATKLTSLPPSPKRNARPRTAPSTSSPSTFVAASSPPPALPPLPPLPPPPPPPPPPSEPVSPLVPPASKSEFPRRRPLPLDHKVPLKRDDERSRPPLSAINPINPRKWTPSMYSFASDTTYLGEFPDHSAIDQRIGNIDEAMYWREVQGRHAAMFLDDEKASAMASAASASTPAPSSPSSVSPSKNTWSHTWPRSKGSSRAAAAATAAAAASSDRDRDRQARELQALWDSDRQVQPEPSNDAADAARRRPTRDKDNGIGNSNSNNAALVTAAAAAAAVAVAKGPAAPVPPPSLPSARSKPRNKFWGLFLPRRAGGGGSSNSSNNDSNSTIVSTSSSLASPPATAAATATATAAAVSSSSQPLSLSLSS
ncbi:MAG: hypothetical protein M1815_002016 [Lichina confinis]|nr:MAG: hypothetical protein M1815_002016 [Lichina confinis]